MNLKEQVKESKRRTKQMVKEHKGDIVYGLYLTACIAAALTPFVRAIRKNQNDVKKERLIYDPHMGFYWEVKKSLTNNQKLMIEQRHRMGESYGEILRDMKLLKK